MPLYVLWVKHPVVTYGGIVLHIGTARESGLSPAPLMCVGVCVSSLGGLLTHRGSFTAFSPVLSMSLFTELGKLSDVSKFPPSQV